MSWHTGPLRILARTALSSPGMYLLVKFCSVHTATSTAPTRATPVTAVVSLQAKSGRGTWVQGAATMQDPRS